MGGVAQRVYLSTGQAAFKPGRADVAPEIHPKIRRFGRIEQFYPVGIYLVYNALKMAFYGRILG